MSEKDEDWIIVRFTLKKTEWLEMFPNLGDETESQIVWGVKLKTAPIVGDLILVKNIYNPENYRYFKVKQRILTVNEKYIIVKGEICSKVETLIIEGR